MEIRNIILAVAILSLVVIFRFIVNIEFKERIKTINKKKENRKRR